MKDPKLEELIESGNAILAVLRDETSEYSEWICKAHDAEMRWKKAVQAIRQNESKSE